MPAATPRSPASVAAEAIALGPPVPGSVHANVLEFAPSFSRLATAAMNTGRRIELRGRTFRLNDEIRVPAGATLSIQGPGTIVGDGHSIIRAGGSRQLVELIDVALIHCGSTSRVERRELGGAIFALGKTKVSLRGCNITSAQGFGVWMVQRARVDLADGSVIHGCGRSGVVSFGDARLGMTGAGIRDCALHGICARGRSRVTLVDSHVDRAGVRGIYAYHNVTVEMRHSSVRGTRDPAAAALQVEALLPGDRCVLRMDSACELDETNQGDRLLVRGNVLVEDLNDG